VHPPRRIAIIPSANSVAGLGADSATPAVQCRRCFDIGNYGKALVYKDPYGVKLEDSTDHLLALRGKPDAVEGKAWRYGPVDGIHWLYTIKDGTVSEILLSLLPKLL
jgi:hypothetical protein